MRHSRQPGNPLLPAATDAPPGVALRTGGHTPSQTSTPAGVLPSRRKSPQELAARQRHAELRVLGEIRGGMGDAYASRARQARLNRLQREKHAAKPLLAYRFAIPAVAALVFLLGGLYFELSMGGGFLFFGSAALRAAMPWVVGALVPVFVWAFFRFERVLPELAQTIPGAFFRTVIAYPFLALMCAAAMAAAPWGWVAYLGWMAGTPQRVDARVVSVEVLRNYVPCGQHARLEFRGTVARICVDGRLTDKPPAAGDAVAVYGRVSRLGMYVREIHAK
ncbi:MAG: hypothetical protein ACO1PM_10470 [Acidovorax sp.]